MRQWAMRQTGTMANMATGSAWWVHFVITLPLDVTVIKLHFLVLFLIIFPPSVHAHQYYIGSPQAWYVHIMFLLLKVKNNIIQHEKDPYTLFCYQRDCSNKLIYCINWQENHGSHCMLVTLLIKAIRIHQLSQINESLTIITFWVMLHYSSVYQTVSHCLTGHD